MYENVCSRFQLALITARVPVVHVKFVAKNEPVDAKTSYERFRGGFLKFHWLHEPGPRDTNMVERLVEYFDWDGAAMLDTGKSVGDILKILASMPESALQPLLLKGLAYLLSKDKDFARECGIYL